MAPPLSLLLPLPRLQIVTESFLEDINNVLNSGEVPNLYASDEMEKIVNMVRPLAKGSFIETLLAHRKCPSFSLLRALV